MSAKPQRIRDPLHNLIEFDTGRFEQMLWRIVQSAPFQRLRRIKQLGFSEMVYPGATHTRFTHSLGTYHIAKQLFALMEKNTAVERNDLHSHHAIAAALVHDLGHGPFSHAFEEVGKKLTLPMASHENVGQAIILETEVGSILNEYGGEGFKNNVANVIKAGSAVRFGAIVSSQFDADRLDYMQRDRFMSGTQLSGIDFKWLLANMEVADIPWGTTDDAQEGTRQSFVLGQKAYYAAEAYVLSLFQLYPTIYYHKATRSAEKLFTEMFMQFFQLVRDDRKEKTRLPLTHPLMTFANSPESLDSALALDDAVIWGALTMLAESPDPLLANAAKRLQARKFYKCTDVGHYLNHHLTDPDTMLIKQESMKEKAVEWSQEHTPQGHLPRILIDEGKRDPYKKVDEEKGPANQILIKDSAGKPVDLATVSDVVKSLKLFTFCRFYTASDDAEAKQFIEQEMRGALQ